MKFFFESAQALLFHIFFRQSLVLALFNKTFLWARMIPQYDNSAIFGLMFRIKIVTKDEDHFQQRQKLKYMIATLKDVRLRIVAMSFL